MAVEFHDFTIKVIDVMDDTINTALEECAAVLERQAGLNSRVDSGQTKGSFQHKVIDSEHTAYIGSNHENAIWEELGTGEYALEGNGRKGGWVYVDDKGKGHFTRGKKPSRAFYKAYNSLKNPIIKMLQERLKGMG